jgi:hypothetical protein
LFDEKPKGRKSRAAVLLNKKGLPGYIGQYPDRTEPQHYPKDPSSLFTKFSSTMIFGSLSLNHFSRHILMDHKIHKHLQGVIKTDRAKPTKEY